MDNDTDNLYNTLPPRPFLRSIVRCIWVALRPTRVSGGTQRNISRADVFKRPTLNVIAAVVVVVIKLRMKLALK